MALIRSKILDNGSVVNYWRVDMLCKNKGSKRVNFAMMGFNSQEIANEKPNEFLECIGVNDLMDSENIKLYEQYFGSNNFKDTETACYEYVKEHVEFFKDAQDDPDEIELLKD